MGEPAGRAGVVLPAGGEGRRMGGAPKQFRLLGGAPVLVQTTRAFVVHPAVDALVVVVPEEAVEETAELFQNHDVEADVVAGGATRQASVGAGLAALAGRVDLALVHDAVRPFVTAALIHRVVEAVRQHGAAAAALPVSDTLRRSDGAVFGDAVERDGTWAMQTPQGARLDWLLAAHARHGSPPATDEVGLLQRAGRLVEGDARNLKLTRPDDWALAEALWASIVTSTPG